MICPKAATEPSKNKERNGEKVKELMKKIGKHFLEAAAAYYQMTH